MAFQPHELIQLGDVIADSIVRYSQRTAGVAHHPKAFTRIHPAGVVNTATAAGVELGATLSCLRYMTRRPPGVQVNCDPAYTLTLDPRYTAPNAAVAVSFRGGNSWNEYAIMRPGDTLEMPEGFQRFYVFNADMQDQIFDLVNKPTNANLGYCSFLIGRYPGAIPHFDSQPQGLAALIQQGVIPNPSVDIQQNVAKLGFSCQGLKAIRAQIVPRDAGGNSISGSAQVYAWLVGMFYRRQPGVIAPIFPPETENVESGNFFAAGNNVAVVHSGVVPYGNQSTVMDTGGNIHSEVLIPVPRNAIAGMLAFAAAGGAASPGFISFNAGAPVTDLFAMIEGVPL